MNTADLRREFEDLLYYEAWLLDHDRLEEGLALGAEQVRYWAPVRANVARGSEDRSRPHLLAHFDEDKGSLAMRVQRIRTGAAHADEPPSRVRHLVANVRVLDSNTEVATVTSNFLVLKSRRGREESLFGGVPGGPLASDRRDVEAGGASDRARPRCDREYHRALLERVSLHVSLPTGG